MSRCACCNALILHPKAPDRYEDLCADCTVVVQLAVRDTTGYVDHEYVQETARDGVTPQKHILY